MNLPFTPTFFKKIDIYHQLIDIEKEVDVKPIWKAEKIVLIWAVGKEHQDIGEYVRTRNITSALESEVKKGGRLGTDAVDYAVSKKQQVLNALVSHGFGETHESDNHVRINQNGFIAGNILKETNYLENTVKYQIWTWIWWFVLIAAALVLLNQALNALCDIIERLLSNLLIWYWP